MKNLDGFTPFFTVFDFGVRKQDAKGFIDFGASVTGYPNQGYRVFVPCSGKRSALLCDWELFHKLHLTVGDVVAFYDLCEEIVENHPSL